MQKKYTLTVKEVAAKHRGGGNVILKTIQAIKFSMGEPDNSDARKSVLVTGGTGSFGRAFIKEALKNEKEYRRIVIYSRDELKQWEMQQEFSAERYPQLRYFIGDIIDKDRL